MELRENKTKNRNIEMNGKGKVKKYFENNLQAGDFVLFPSGQPYKVLISGRTYPACMKKGCKKLAQAKVVQSLFILSSNKK